MNAEVSHGFSSYSTNAGYFDSSCNCSFSIKSVREQLRASLKGGSLSMSFAQRAASLPSMYSADLLFHVAATLIQCCWRRKLAVDKVWLLKLARDEKRRKWHGENLREIAVLTAQTAVRRHLAKKVLHSKRSGQPDVPALTINSSSNEGGEFFTECAAVAIQSHVRRMQAVGRAQRIREGASDSATSTGGAALETPSGGVVRRPQPPSEVPLRPASPRVVVCPPVVYRKGEGLAAVFWDACSVLLDPRVKKHFFGLHSLHDAAQSKRKELPNTLPGLPFTLWADARLPPASIPCDLTPRRFLRSADSRRSPRGWLNVYV